MKKIKNKYKLSDATTIAISRGGRCLSTEYVNTKHKMLWRCKNGHEWEEVFRSTIKEKEEWCPECRNEKMRLGIKIARAIAEENGGRCLSTAYINAWAKLEWECSCGYIWFSTLANIKYNKSWCPKCANVIKYDIDTCISIAKNRNGKCLSTEYTNNRAKLEWKCEFGHVWKSCLSDIMSGNWCKKCFFERNKLGLECAIEIAKNQGGRCLSNEYKNAKSKLEWECENGHMWFAKLDSVKNSKTWCPKCKALKTQNKVAEIVQNIFKNCEVKQNYRGFEWLEIDGNRQEIDIYVFNKNKKFTIGIEYDGEQHFKPIRFGGMSYKKAVEVFNRIKILDRNKNKKVAENKNDLRYFIRIKYNEPICEEHIREKIFSEVCV